MTPGIHPAGPLLAGSRLHPEGRDGLPV